jgi:hypothetical protein
VAGKGNFDSTIDVIFPFISHGHVSCWLTDLIICRVSIVVKGRSTFVLSGVAIELLFASLLLELL